MPIRINLLAEQQIAEEQRLRDPVKLGIWVGGFLVALMLLWALSIHFEVQGARADLAKYEAELQSMDEGKNLTKSNYFASRTIEHNLMSLDKYVSNRFLCANVMDAVQRAVADVDQVRLEKLDSKQEYFTNAPTKFKTNMVFNLPTRSWWQFGKSAGSRTNFLTWVTNQLVMLTNQARFLTNTFERTTRVMIVTNREKTKVTAQIDIATPATAVERATLLITARDYSSPPGQQVNLFSEAIWRLPFFKAALETNEGQGVRWKELASLPAEDPNDPSEATRKASFIRFTIECRFKDKILSNE